MKKDRKKESNQSEEIQFGGAEEAAAASIANQKEVEQARAEFLKELSAGAITPTSVLLSCRLCLRGVETVLEDLMIGMQHPLELVDLSKLDEAATVRLAQVVAVTIPTPGQMATPGEDFVDGSPVDDSELHGEGSAPSVSGSDSPRPAA